MYLMVLIPRQFNFYEFTVLWTSSVGSFKFKVDAPLEIDGSFFAAMF